MLELVRIPVRRLFDSETWWRWLRTPKWSAVTTERNTTYSGEYAAWDSRRRRGVTLRGYIVEWPGLAADVYLYDPPEVLRQHPHGACLQLLRPEDKWFYLHWTRPAPTFQESREYVEQMLWAVSPIDRCPLEL